ncbi:hypothetical protein CRUP_005456 [Coryphaenoides rupestris]|nr:hypothetical protein CRUP_005456 [Coryphaenoides rupestris]
MIATKITMNQFDLRTFLCSESEQLIWKSEGLPSDDLSMENALVILQVGPSPLHPTTCPWSHWCLVVPHI